MNHWITCKQCGHTYVNTVERCPNCYLKTPWSFGKIFGTVIATLLICATSGAVVYMSLNLPTPENIDTSGVVHEPGVNTTTSTTAADRRIGDKDGAVAGTFDGEVTLTIPEWLLLSVEPDFDYTLTDKEKEMHFTAIHKNDDGSATYTIDSYENLNAFKGSMATAVDTLLTSWEQTEGVHHVTTTDGFSEVHLYTDFESFDKLNAAFTNAVVVTGLYATMYQYADIDVPLNCDIYIYGTNNRLLGTSAYPEMGELLYQQITG